MIKSTALFNFICTPHGTHRIPAMRTDATLLRSELDFRHNVLASAFSPTCKSCARFWCHVLPDYPRKRIHRVHWPAQAVDMVGIPRLPAEGHVVNSHVCFVAAAIGWFVLIHTLIVLLVLEG